MDSTSLSHAHRSQKVPSLAHLRQVADFLDPPEGIDVRIPEGSKRIVGRWLKRLYGSNVEPVA